MKKQVYKDIYKIKKSILPTVFLNALLSAAEPFIFVYISGYLLKFIIEAREISFIIKFSVAAAAISFALHYIKNITENYKLEYGDYLNTNEKNILIKKLFSLDFKDLEAKDTKDKILRHKEESDGMSTIYMEAMYQFYNFTVNILSIIIAIVSLISFYPALSKSVDIKVFGSKYFPLLIIFLMLVIIYALINFRKRAEEKNEIDRETYAKKYKIYDYYMRLLSDYESLKQIKIYDEKAFILDDINENFVKSGLGLRKKIARRTGFSEGMDDFLLSTLGILFLIMLAIKAKGGLFGVDKLIIYYGAFKALCEAAKELIKTIGEEKALEPKIAILYDILNLKSDKKFEVKEKDFTETLISVKDLSFSYPDSKITQLKNLNLEIRRGEKIAIVGENGSGKTTFVNLLTGLYKVNEGSILIDGDVPSLDFTAKNIGVVSQDFYLFSFKLGENIATSENYNADECERVLKLANFEKAYDLEQYIYTDIDEDGVDISGGESQKIALARALYNDKDILIFDEPTSKLDPKSEMKIFESFNEAAKGKTVIFISHRMSACKFADRVILFHDGKIIDSAPHEELLKRNEKYKEMWSAQAKYFN